MRLRKSFRGLILLFLGTIGQCYAGTFDLDTIDNWQIYNGTDLVLGGHESPVATEFQGTITTASIKELVIQFNHCFRYDQEFNVTVEIADDKGKVLLTKTFKVGTRMTIEKKELGKLTANSITIRYWEKRNNGTDKVLGRIRLI
jgi:hypothetical protein